ncbi:MAG: hypothetical protein RJA70_1320, partial [Pseudomonadota bacterium]
MNAGDESTPGSAFADAGGQGAALKASGAESPALKTAGLSRAEALSIALVSLVQAAGLGWAAWRLPWAVWTPFSCAAGVAAISHLAVVVSVLLGHPRGLTVFRLSALASLVLLAVVSLSVVHGGAFLVAVYGPLGEGLTAVVAAVWALFFLFTGPTAIWGLVRSRGHAPRLARRRAALRLSALSLLVFVSYGTVTYLRERLGASAPPLASGELQELAASAERQSPPSAAQRPISIQDVSTCARPVSEAQFTLFVTAPPKAGSPGEENTARRCFQGPERSAVLSQARDHLASLGAAGPVVLDWVLGVQRLTSVSGLLSSLALRPGLDGLCHGTRCYLPWQLLARGDFAVHQPLEFVGDLRFGAELALLRQGLASSGQSEDETKLYRFESQNIVLRDGEARELRRLRPVHLPELSSDAGQAQVLRAAKLAQDHIVSAQEKDGRFRYVMDPFTGAERSREFSLARQAGTLLVLCELGERSPEVERAISRGLQFLKQREIVFAEGRMSALAPETGSRRLWSSDSVLPLVAFARCRSRAGELYDSTITRLAAFVLEMQAPDGTIRPEYRFPKTRAKLGTTRVAPGAAIDGIEPLFVSGQAALAFVLLQKDAYAPPAVSRAKVREGAQKAMDYVAHRHWDHGLSPFFFIEENWHCLAAREALDVQRHDRYETFCLDFMRFKSRVILDANESTPVEFVGGHGFGAIVPPHNTGTSGFAEAMAAAIAVKKARAEELTAS